jgi:hypothetical protein
MATIDTGGLMSQIKPVLRWYWNTSALVGVPVLFVLLVMMMDKTLSTVTCQIAGENCDRAIGALPSNVKIDLPGYTYSGEITGEPAAPTKKGK